jgi:hypothetical protein
VSTTQPPDLTAHLDAAVLAADTLGGHIRAALLMLPDDPRFAGVRGNFVESLRHVEHAVDFRTARGLLAEMARVKGPDVAIYYPARRGADTLGSAELAEVTPGALIMRGDRRYSRKTGREIGYGDNPWRGGAPYITEAERARVLALPRPPATAAAKKAPHRPPPPPPTPAGL